MKKSIIMGLGIVYALSSCTPNEIYTQYQSVNQTWYVEQAETLPTVAKEVKFIDFSRCKISKKLAKNENGGCIAPVNSFELDGTVLGYSIKRGQLININEVRHFPSDQNEGITLLQPTQLEKDLAAELVGEWHYTVDGNNFTLTKGDKTLVFRL